MPFGYGTITTTIGRTWEASTDGPLPDVEYVDLPWLADAPDYTLRQIGENPDAPVFPGIFVLLMHKYDFHVFENLRDYVDWTKRPEPVEVTYRASDPRYDFTYFPVADSDPIGGGPLPVSRRFDFNNEAWSDYGIDFSEFRFLLYAASDDTITLPADGAKWNEWFKAADIDTPKTVIFEILLGGGDDSLSSGLTRVNVFAQEGNDAVRGSRWSDTIDGGSDNDAVKAGGGADSVVGGLGADKLLGGSGPDTMEGGDENDTLYGDEANDRLYGGTGFDFVSGGAGDDLIFAGTEGDTLDGGLDDDTLWSSTEDDGFFSGQDYLIGGTGKNTYVIDGGDTVSAFASDDGSIIFVTENPITRFGVFYDGKQTEVRAYSAAGWWSYESVFIETGLSAMLLKGTANTLLGPTGLLLERRPAPAGNDPFAKFAADPRAAKSDVEKLKDALERLHKVYIDSASGFVVSETVKLLLKHHIAKAASELLVEAAKEFAKSATLVLKFGEFAIAVGFVLANELNGNYEHRPNDRLEDWAKAFLKLVPLGDFAYQLGKELVTGLVDAIEQAIDEAAHWTYRIRQNDSGYGDTGDPDFYISTPGDDAPDTKKGTGGGDDSFVGASAAGPVGKVAAAAPRATDGNDIFNGGADVDTVYYTQALAGIVADLAKGTARGAHIGNDRLISIENVTGSRFADRITGSSVANELVGGDGNDTLSGAAGDDLIEGGLGADLLNGGAGRDTFLLLSVAHTGKTAKTIDVIEDFAAGDKIDLSYIDADATTARDQAFILVENAGLDGEAGQLAFRRSGGSTVIEGDIDGDGKADFVLRLTGSHALEAADFIL